MVSHTSFDIISKIHTEHKDGRRTTDWRLSRPRSNFVIFSEELINLFIAFTPVWLKPHLSPYTRQGDGLIEGLYSIYLNVSNLKEYIQRDMLTYSVHFLFILFKRACRYERSYIIFFSDLLTTFISRWTTKESTRLVPVILFYVDTRFWPTLKKR